jgi:ribonuclease HI
MPSQIDINDWILSWLTCHDTLGTQLFCTILWKFWAARNNVVFRGDGLEPVRLADSAMSFVREFNETNPSIRGRVSPPVITTMPSVPAPSFSVFVDAGCNSNGPTVWGIVFKNHDMITTFSASKYDDIAVDPVMAEALGVRWAIQLVREQGLQSAFIYSDAANVVDCIYNKVKIAAIEMVTQDCRDLLSSLPNVSVLFVRREQNVDAHNLASLARLVGNRTWVGAAPNVSVSSTYAGSATANCIMVGCVPVLF